MSGQSDVEQDDVRVLALDDVQRRLAVAGPQDIDLAPLEREPEPDRLDDVGLVVDDEDLHHGSSSGGPAVGTTRVNVLPRPGWLSDLDRPTVRLGDGERASAGRGPRLPAVASGRCRPTKNRSNSCAWSSGEMPGRHP